MTIALRTTTLGPRCPAAPLPRGARRGQALIMVVLLMFGLIALSGVFIAVISQALTQTTRGEQREALQAVLEAGLAYAQNELLYSPDGADWTPPQGPDTAPLNRGWIHHGDGFYKISVSYGPTKLLNDSDIFGANPLDKYLHVTVQARLALPEPTQVPDTDPEYPAYQEGSTRGLRQERTAQAFMPIGLTDYLRWITNIDGTPEPVTLGSTLELVDPVKAEETPTPVREAMKTVNADPDESPTFNDPAEYDNRKISSTIVPYLAVFNGPIRSETDLRIANARIDLTNKAITSAGSDATDYETAYGVVRHDAIEVAGSLTAEKFDSVSDTGINFAMVNQHTDPIGAGPANIKLLDSSTFSSAPRDVLHTLANDQLIRPLRAPRLDARHPTTGLDRYRALTLGTAAAVTPTALGPNASLLQGAGLYISNPTHIQYDHNNSTLRSEWLNPDGGGAWTSPSKSLPPPPPPISAKDYTYDPVSAAQAIQITLGDWEAAPTTSPRISITYPTGGGATATLPNIPYPKNGVIFAEGNVVVKGDLPASLAYTWDAGAGRFEPEIVGTRQQVGGTASNSAQYFVEESAGTINRRFDLTIVSAGTVYIEGNLLTPSSRQETYALNGGGSSVIQARDRYDSKLALLAMDNVCLNPTKLLIYRNGSLTDLDNRGAFWKLDGTSTNPLDVDFATSGDWTNKKPWLLLRHCGKYSSSTSTTQLRMDINGASYSWADLGTNLLFDESGNTPPHGGGLFTPTVAGNVWPLTSPTATIPLSIFGEKNTLSFTWAGGTDPYWQSVGYQPDIYEGDIGPGALVTRLDLQVDALLYAQRGSWFVIPGRYYNAGGPLNNMWGWGPSGTNTKIWPFPSYKEPMDLRIVVNGAIVENRPAPADEERQWLAHWRGSNLDYFATGGAGTSPDRWDPGNATWDPAKWRWTNRRMGIEYHYDATLMRPVCYHVNDDGTYRYLPRLPKLPVSPNLTNFSRTM